MPYRLTKFSVRGKANSSFDVERRSRLQTWRSKSNLVVQLIEP